MKADVCITTKSRDQHNHKSHITQDKQDLGYKPCLKLMCAGRRTSTVQNLIARIKEEIFHFTFHRIDLNPHLC